MSANTKVVLNGEQLLAQSQELTKLMGEYDSMFTSMRTILNEMNDGWSANLSNNFAGKITVAQKGFSKIVEIIECGALAAKEAANGFEDMNTILGRGLNEIFPVAVPIGIGIAIENIFKDLPKDLPIPEGIKVIDSETLREILISQDIGLKNPLDTDGLISIFSQIENEVYGTNTIAEAANVLKVGEDLFDGTVASDTVHTITDLFGGYDELLSKVGFTDGIPSKIIQKGIDNIYGDGENIGTISSSMVEFVDDFEAVKDAWKEGNYTEAVMTGYMRAIEGGIKVTTESIYELGTGALKGVVNGIEDHYNVDLSGLENIGRELDQGIRSVGKTISDAVGDYVDYSVECVPIVADYLEETASNIMEGIASGVSNLWEGVKSIF